MLDFSIGMRDSFENFYNDNLILNSNESLFELYWNIILLMESQFLTRELDLTSFKRFRKSYLINKFSGKLNSAKIDSIVTTTSFWRNVGDYYMILYLPLYYNNLIYCKISSIYLHIVLPQNFNILKNCKDWLLSFLEMGNLHNCSFLRLYINRDNTNIQSILRNLNWIGGKMIQNEDRNNIQDLNDLLLGDENFIILEFEC